MLPVKKDKKQAQVYLNSQKGRLFACSGYLGDNFSVINILAFSLLEVVPPGSTPVLPPVVPPVVNPVVPQ